MDRRSQTVAQPTPRLEFGVHVACPNCRGKGKTRAVFDPKTGRWYAPKCGFCKGRAIVHRDFAAQY